MNKFNKRELSWILYDCGNSAYSMAITTAILPVYFGMFKTGQSMDLGYFNSLASILVAILSPILGTIADYKGYKKKFFLIFFMLGVVTTGLLALVPYGMWQLLVALYILTVVGFAATNVFYDSFLVDVSVEENMDRVSSAGFAYGYIASVVPFGISLLVIYLMGMDNLTGYKLSFVITALWWFVLSLPMIKNVNQVYGIEKQDQPVKRSFERIFATLKDIKKRKMVFIFLIAYFLYIDGVDTIIKMCVPYAQSLLKDAEFNSFLLLGILLVIQIIAFPCALIYGNLGKKFGTLNMIIVGIITYIVAVFFAFFIKDIKDIFILGALVGSAQGGIQALSRSYFARLIPKENSNEFFGFYNIFGKFASIFGPLIMAFITDVTGDPRLSILGILPLFILGLFIILYIKKNDFTREEE